MKNYTGLVFAVILVMSLVTPVQKTHAMEKIDPALVKMGLNQSQPIGFFVELNGNTVVDSATFNSSNTIFSSKEIMRPGNLLTYFAQKRLVVSQNKSIEKVASIGKEISIGMKYQYVFNGYYVTAPMADIVKIADMPDVKSIIYCPPQYVDRTRARQFLGCEKIWNTVKDPKGRSVDGSGMLVGVTDSGLDYTHTDFGAQKSPVGEKVKVSKDLAYNDNDCQEEENLQTAGHGTACAGIIAADGLFNQTTKVWEKGLAPKAKLASFKIGMKEQSGLSGEGIMASWEYNVKEKVDVSSNSYGGVGGYSPFEGAQTRCAKAGVLILAAQGNEGSPGPNMPIPAGTTSAPMSVIGVAALDDTNAAKIEITDTDFAKLQKKVLLSGVGNNNTVFSSLGTSFELVDCSWGRQSDFSGLDLNGKIALIQRGPSPDLKDKFGAPITFQEKCTNAAKAGAKAMILYNYDTSPLGVQYWDPTKDDIKKLKFIPSFELASFLQGYQLTEALHSGHQWQLGSPDANQNKLMLQVKDIGRKGIMSTYSSAGPNVYGYLKPDISAPADGTHTTAAYFVKPYFKSDWWEVFNGTSAATPMTAGCATLVRQGRPEWGPFEVKRALMNTADPLKRIDGDYYVPMTMQGMGRVNAYNAITSNLLIQPASTCILAQSDKVNMTDPAAELFDERQADIPADVLQTRIPVKVANYGDKPSTVGLSFEINSAHPDQISVNMTATEIKIPAMDKKGNPGVAWLGVDVKYPQELKGRLNDVYIWFTDIKQNKKWHIGICLYNQDPTTQGLNDGMVGEVEVVNKSFTPNGDGDNDYLEVNYELVNGNCLYSTYDNYMMALQFWAVDQNQERWVLINEEPFLEIGPHSFKWDGKDENGNYVLPDGDWSIQALAPGLSPQGDQLAWVWYFSEAKNSDFTIEKSTVPSLPTISAHVLPLEPGVGQVFEVGVYLSNAKDIKSLQFKMHLPGASTIIQYMGYDKSDFLTKDEPLTLFTIDYDKDKEIIDASIQRPLDGVSGSGWVLKLKFMAKESNFFDIQFSDLIMSMVDDTGKEIKSKGFYKNDEVTILEQKYDQADFNRDGKVDEADLKIIMNALDSQDTDSRYNWRCDLNYDDYVDFRDMAIFSKSYSKH